MDDIDLVVELAKGYNNLEITAFENVVVSNVIYDSQNELYPIVGWSDLRNHLLQQFAAINKSKFRLYAELGYWGSRPCIILSQGSKELKKAVVLISFQADKICRINYCTGTPSWNDVLGTNQYPR
jgi:hypothetical protein